MFFEDQLLSRELSHVSRCVSVQSINRTVRLYKLRRRFVFIQIVFVYCSTGTIRFSVILELFTQLRRGFDVTINDMHGKKKMKFSHDEMNQAVETQALCPDNIACMFAVYGFDFMFTQEKQSSLNSSWCMSSHP